MVLLFTTAAAVAAARVIGSLGRVNAARVAVIVVVVFVVVVLFACVFGLTAQAASSTHRKGALS
jgi:hypothetical protein